MHGLKSYIIERIADARGVAVADMNKEWHRRAIFLDAALKHGVTDYKDVADLVAAYRAHPEETFDSLVEGETAQARKEGPP